MSNPRAVKVTVNYAGKNITDQIKDYVLGLTYTDIASGASDSLSLDLSNKDKKWMGAWLPSKGDKISATIQLKNWIEEGKHSKLYCGKFTLDDLSLSGGRSYICTIGAVAIPQDDAFNNDEKTKTWEKVTVEEIAKEISKKAKIALHYDAGKIPIEIIEQNGQTDCSFLLEVCQSYGLAMKIFANKLVIFDEQKYEKKKSVATIDEKDMIDWSYNTTIKGTYTGALVSYTDPINDKECKVSIGGGNRILKLNVSADNAKDAERKGQSLLHNANKNMTTLNVVIKADPKIIASSNINITGLEKLDGKYYVDKVKHRITGNDAYNMSLTLRLITSSSDSKKQTANTSGNYTVQKGDTLWSIAKKHLGSGAKYKEIYNMNKQVIEDAAKARGRNNSSNGDYIYPGTVLVIP